MSANVSPVESTVGGVNGIQLHANTVSLNEVVQQVIRGFSSQKANNTIIRCEALPQVSARKEQIAELFQGLLSTIFEEVPNGSKLFLYIDCRAEKDASAKLLQHEILINTNITCCDSWQQRHQETLEHCSELAKKIGGSLQTNINSTGCVFVISLPR